MEVFRKRSILMKYLEIYHIKIVLALKRSKEYKINFWMMTFFDLTLLLTTLLFFYTLKGFIGEVINWNMFDFFVYFTLDLISWKVLWQHNLRDFPNRLLQGELNDTLMRPVNIYFMSSIKLVSGNNLVSSIFMISYLIPIMIMFYTNFYLAWLVIIFSWFYFMAFANFLDSFSFFFKRVEMLIDVPYRLNSVTKRFTPKLFENFSLFGVIYLMPAAVHAFFIIEIMKGNSQIFFDFFNLIFGSFIFFIFGTFVLWHYGLKKYEALG
ncbi:MAG: hypothetical protein PF569_10030 [Candidatus Woesearchaeota archaeon]|nr:hypothetical protein [Candidatus Woesearchaeota archaeon]